MAEVSRRELVVGLAGLAAAGVARGQPQVVGEAKVAEQDLAAGSFAGGSRVFAVSAMTPVTSANGAERLVVLDGRLPTGEVVGMHESWTPPGLPPVALHRINHSELIVVLEGEVEFVHDGRAERAAAGDVIYVAYGTVHAVRNTGPGRARYVVTQVGKG